MLAFVFFGDLGEVVVGGRLTLEKICRTPAHSGVDVCLWSCG